MKNILELYPGSGFGEIALLTKSKRFYTFRKKKKLLFAKLTRKKKKAMLKTKFYLNKKFFLSFNFSLTKYF